MKGQSRFRALLPRSRTPPPPVPKAEVVKLEESEPLGPLIPKQHVPIALQTPENQVPKWRPFQPLGPPPQQTDLNSLGQGNFSSSPNWNPLGQGSSSSSSNLNPVGQGSSSSSLTQWVKEVLPPSDWVVPGISDWLVPGISPPSTPPSSMSQWEEQTPPTRQLPSENGEPGTSPSPMTQWEPLSPPVPPLVQLPAVEYLQEEILMRQPLAIDDRFPSRDTSGHFCCSCCCFW